MMKDGIDVAFFYCIIHQQALFSKSINMYAMCNENMHKNSKHNALTHRRFKSFLDEMLAEYGDLLLYTEVRWLSRGKCLERLFELREEVIDFLEEENLAAELLESFKSPKFICQFGFLCDISNHLNQLNLSLQGKGKFIFDLYASVTEFERKIIILTNQLKNKDLSNLPKTLKIAQQYPDDIEYDVCYAVLESLQNEIS